MDVRVAARDDAFSTTTVAKAQKQHILSDPVTRYSALYADADNDALTALAMLSRQLKSLKPLRKQVREKIRFASARIGEAKRNGNSVPELMLAMQELSRHLTSINDEIAKLENQVLGFFESSKEVALPKARPSEASATRIYRGLTEDISNICVSLLDNEQSEWNAYVSKQPVATIHHRAEWRNLLQKTYGHDSRYYMARDSHGRVVGVLPLVRLKSRLFGDLLVSMPYFQRGGAIADHPSVENHLMQCANTDAANLGIHHIEYRDDILREGPPVRSNKVNMVLELPDSIDILWSGFRSKLRAQIKRAQREQPQVLSGGQQYVDDFFMVYSRNMRDLGSPSHSKQFLNNILDYFPANSWIIVLRLDNRPVAAGLLLGHGNTLEIPLASTVRDVNPLSMNMVLYWEVLKFAIDQGFRYFDFGRSSKASGTFRFKQQWGAKPQQLYFHYWLKGGAELPSLNADNPRYALAVKVWKRLPLFVTRYLGPSVVKNLP